MGRLIFADASPAAGKDFTDDGRVEHFGVGKDGRLFHSENGNPIQPSTYWRVWGKTRALALTPTQIATPLMRRPYDLRHSGITWRLNSGVPPTEIAAWAGHSVDMLLRVYARCVAGLEDVWITRDDAAEVRAPTGHPGAYRGEDRRWVAHRCGQWRNGYEARGNVPAGQNRFQQVTDKRTQPYTSRTFRLSWRAT